MGGTTASLPSNNALATITNPGQLGLFALNNLFSAEIYAPKTQWLPPFHLDGLTYYSEAVNAGVNLGNICRLPFSFSAGFGYSRIDLELGEFIITDETGPEPIGRYHGSEKSNNFSAGFAFEYYVRIGLGWNFKTIRSDLVNAAAKVTATDFGLLIGVPVMAIVSTLTKEEFEIAPKVTPLFDLSFGNVRSNVGGEVSYIDNAQADPLPRTAVIGGSIEAGLIFRSGFSNRKLVTITLIRQAEDLLVTRFSGSKFSYQTGLGDIAFVDNVILGKTNPKVDIRKGWQLQVAEALYIRGGSVDGPGLAYATSGYSICLRGLARLVDSGNPRPAESWIDVVTEHIDLQYHSSTYTSISSPIDGTTTSAINLVVNGFSF